MMAIESLDVSPNLDTQIRIWAEELGFSALGVSDANLSESAPFLQEWLLKGWHGDMEFMSRHAELRRQPSALFSGVKRVISVRMNYWPQNAAPAETVLDDRETAYIARYALGRDYHRTMRRRLQLLADRITEQVGAFRYRAFVDSAPVMEKPLAQSAGLGWMGKHTNLIDPVHGSWFFLGELYTDLPLPISPPGHDHCGTCQRCAIACPTGALDTPYQLDARKCIAYLTIEHKSAIPEELREAVGNRVFGCDDCQLVCPHNRDAPHGEDLFEPRHGLDAPLLTALFAWTDKEFDYYTQGSAIRRLGYERWMRNVAVALGNSKPSTNKIEALSQRLGAISDMVDEHIVWAIEKQRAGLSAEDHAL